MDNKKVKKSKKKRKTKKKKKPIDDETARLAAEQAKKELVEFLATKTDLTEDELLVSYDEFHEKYPSGEINKKEFLEQSKVIKCTLQTTTKSSINCTSGWNVSGGGTF